MEKKLKNDGDYNFTEITKSSQRTLRGHLSIHEIFNKSYYFAKLPEVLHKIILIDRHNISFMEKLPLFIVLIPTPDFLHFYYILGANLG